MFFRKKSSQEYIEKSFYSLGTLNHIKIYNYNHPELLEIAENRIYEIDDKMSSFKTNSDITKLNNNAGKKFVQIGKDTFKVLEQALHFSKISAGAFDITIKPLVNLWGINKKDNFVPSIKEINKAKKLINYNDLILNKKDQQAMLKYPGQAIDLGGIAKGYAADEVKQILTNHNVKSALINLGGNIIVIGRRPDGNPWQVGIQNPLAVTGEHFGVVTTTNKTIVTSGTNERFFILNNVRYHHILDPQTGYPVNSNLLSVTVISDFSIEADALTTCLFILGPEKGLELLKNYQAEAIYVKEDLGILATEGLKENFQLID